MFILNDYYTDYKTCLICLNLAITYHLHIEHYVADIMFFIKSLKNPTDNFNILDFVSFFNNPTRSPPTAISTIFYIKQSILLQQNPWNPERLTGH